METILYIPRRITFLKRTNPATLTGRATGVNPTYDPCIHNYNYTPGVVEGYMVARWYIYIPKYQYWYILEGL
jgi:hypothetical protein